jgi:hypothetical protein
MQILIMAGFLHRQQNSLHHYGRHAIAYDFAGKAITVRQNVPVRNRLKPCQTSGRYPHNFAIWPTGSRSLLARRSFNREYWFSASTVYRFAAF